MPILASICGFAFVWVAWVVVVCFVRVVAFALCVVAFVCFCCVASVAPFAPFCVPAGPCLSCTPFDRTAKKSLLLGLSCDRLLFLSP